MNHLSFQIGTLSLAPLTFPALAIGPGTLKLQRGRCCPSFSTRITPLPPCGMQGACRVHSLGLISCNAFTAGCRRAVLQPPAADPGARMTWARHTGCLPARADRRRRSQQPSQAPTPCNPQKSRAGIRGCRVHASVFSGRAGRTMEPNGCLAATCRCAALQQPGAKHGARVVRAPHNPRVPAGTRACQRTPHAPRSCKFWAW